MYSSVADLIRRWGEVELVRLTTPDGAEALAVDQDKVVGTLQDASALVDSYVRRRYAVPITGTVPAEITRATAVLARHDLSSGNGAQPSKEMTDQRDSVIRWLEGVRDGKVLLDLAVVASSEESHATVSVRPQVFGACDRTGYGYFDP